MKNSMIEGIEHTPNCLQTCLDDVWDIQYLLEPQIQSPVESDVSSEYIRRHHFMPSTGGATYCFDSDFNILREEDTHLVCRTVIVSYHYFLPSTVQQIDKDHLLHGEYTSLLRKLTSSQQHNNNA